MSRLKVMTIVGTRPEIIKLSRVIAELDRHSEHLLVHTGQNYDYELNEVFFQELGIRAPDRFLEAAGETAAETIGQVIARTDALLAVERPDAVLLYGDTNSCLAVISAKRRRVPTFHMEAGNRCFDQRVPEEVNRRIVDHTSDVNMPLTEHARRYLLAEGLRPETVIKTGSTMREVIDFYRPGMAASDVLARLGLQAGEFFVVSSHREENVDEPRRLRRLLGVLSALVGRWGKRVVFSTHPRTRRRLAELGGAGELPPEVAMLPPFGLFDYLRLQQEAFCVLSDSGTLTEEAAILGFPAVMLREAHERPEGMDAGVAVMAGLSATRVLQAVELVTAQHAAGGARSAVTDYGEPDVSRKVVRIILSHVDYVRRTAWYDEAD